MKKRTAVKAKVKKAKKAEQGLEEAPKVEEKKVLALPKKKVKEPKVPVVHYDRIHSIVDAMRMLAGNENASFTKDAVVAKADEIYLQHGGKSNLKESVWNFRYASGALLAAEIIQAQENGSFIFKK